MNIFTDYIEAVHNAPDAYERMKKWKISVHPGRGNSQTLRSVAKIIDEYGGIPFKPEDLYDHRKDSVFFKLPQIQLNKLCKALDKYVKETFGGGVLITITDAYNFYNSISIFSDPEMKSFGKINGEMFYVEAVHETPERSHTWSLTYCDRISGPVSTMQPNAISIIMKTLEGLGTHPSVVNENVIWFKAPVSRMLLIVKALYTNKSIMSYVYGISEYRIRESHYLTDGYDLHPNHVTRNYNSNFIDITERIKHSIHQAPQRKKK